MPQTSVTDPAVGFAGQLADSSDNTVDSFVSEESSAEIPFGVMVKRGTGDHQAKLLAAQADVPVGIVVHSHVYAKDTELGSTGLKPETTLSVLTKGRVWVTVEEAVTPASTVRYRAIATGNEVPGEWRDTADASDTVACLEFARYLTTAGAGGLALLEIDMSGAGARTSD
jgi:hypothetical protein